MNGTAAMAVGMFRHTTANTAGNSLSIQSGGATSGATDKAAGDLLLRPGVSTGIGGANVRIQGMTRATSSGTGDNSAIDRIIVSSAKTLTDAATSLRHRVEHASDVRWRDPVND